MAVKMKKLLRRLSRVGDSSSYEPIGAEEEKLPEAPKGYVPVCAGDEMERFVVPAALLGRPVFVELLQMSAREYGYGQTGALRIPCSVSVFRRVLSSLLGDSHSGRS